MTEVACFCGYCYSFSGNVGACPQCGEYVAVTGDSLDDEPTLRDELRPRQEKALSRSASNLPRASVALAIAPNQRWPGAALRAVFDGVAHAERRPPHPTRR